MKALKRFFAVVLLLCVVSTAQQNETDIHVPSNTTEPVAANITDPLQINTTNTETNTTHL